jgi:beta-lactam-binding protein with PASTA domain
MKNFLKFLISKTFWINVLIAVVLLVVISIIAFNRLDKYTFHDEFVVVPDLKGATIGEAEITLEYNNLKCEVIDSVFATDLQPGAVVEQIPVAGSKVKKSRKLYLVINSLHKKKVSLPDVRDMSLRQARSIIESIGLKVDSIIYVPSEYVDLVQQVQIGERVLQPGEMLTVNTSVDLTVGRGLSDEKVHVPSLREKSKEEAMAVLAEASLNIGSVLYDEKPTDDADASKYFVYKQKPATGTEVNIGKAVDIWLTKSKSQLSEPEEVVLSKDYDIENFFE